MSDKSAIVKRKSAITVGNINSLLADGSTILTADEKAKLLAARATLTAVIRRL